MAGHMKVTMLLCILKRTGFGAGGVVRVFIAQCLKREENYVNIKNTWAGGWP